MKFKKFISLVTMLTMGLSALPPGAVYAADNTLYSQDFESYNVGDKGGWTSPAGTLSIKEDSTTGIGKYQSVVSGKEGTCRSGYVELPSSISDSFVFECDFKSTSNVNVSDLELLESKKSVYANHGRLSNAKYAFTMARPSKSNVYVINNASDDSGLTIDRYTKPSVTSSEISDNPWLHVKVIGDFDSHTTVAYITSLDGKTTYYHGKTDMSPDISSWKCIHLLSPSTGADTCIDNITVTKATDRELSEIFYTATINDGISEFSQYVYSGESVVNIPDVSVYGTAFEGWSVNGKLITTEELSTLPITADTKITAQISIDYVEQLASVEFNDFPANSLLTMGADGDTYADNTISLKITGERGTSLVSNPDDRVTDYKIDWKLDGFRIMDGKATSDSGNTYCDSYGLLEVTEKAQSSVNFKLKNTAANYYGMVTAAVTYNGKTISASKPLLLLADANRDSSVLLPKAGYTANLNKYDDALVGYTANDNDILTGGWSTSGSDSSLITLASDTTDKYLSLTRAASGNSAYYYQTIGDLSAQTVFSQDIRFGTDAYIAYKGGATTDSRSTAFTLSLSQAIKLNGTSVYANAEKGKWYHIEITADPTTKLCFAKVYDISADGSYSDKTPLGSTDSVAFDSSYSSGNYYRISMAKDKSSSVDINNVTIKTAQTDESTIDIVVPDGITIPESGTNEYSLSVSAKATNGDTILGAAEWVLDEAVDGVSVASTGAKTAVLSVAQNAPSGEIPIRVTVNGTSKVFQIKLTGTQNNVVFTNAAKGASIPESGTNEYQYSAELRDGQGNSVSGENVSYSLYNSDNSALLSAAGITLDGSGKLTISSSAQPQTIYIRAAAGSLSRSVKVTVYGTSFSFGTDKMDGYTQVSADTAYSDALGFGMTGTAAANASSMTGSDFGFKLKLEKGNVYEVTAKYKGTIKCERIDSALSGFERTKSALESDTYSTAVFGDGILDITFSGSGELGSISVKKVERTANSKPAWWTIGDSTIQQNGSWAYTIAATSTSELSKYPTLADAVSSFHNSGRAGRQHKSYYSEGLMNSLLCGIKPGDVVSISGMGVNDSISSEADFESYNNAYVDAIEDMGARVMLGSYTPSGNYGATSGKVYDPDSILFKGMRTDIYETAIRSVYSQRIAANDESIIGFIDIGKIADILMTNDVRTVYNNAIAAGKTVDEARTAANARADELMAMWKDYNHYYVSFSNYILPEITARAAQLISSSTQAALPEMIALSSTSSATAAPTTTAAAKATPVATVPANDGIKVISAVTNGTETTVTIDKGFTGTAIAAMYDSNGILRSLLTDTDSTKEHTFKFTNPTDISGYTVKIMNWDSLSGMKPISKALSISLNDIKATAAATTAPTSKPTAAPTTAPTAKPTTAPTADVSTIELTSSDEYIDVSSLTLYGTNECRIYKPDGSCEDAAIESNRVHNTTGGSVTVVPIYKFEFTSQASPTDENIKGYVKAGQGSYSSTTGYGLLNENYSITENGCLPKANPIKADVPNGFYDITVYRVGGTRSDVYSEGTQIINNSTSYGSQNRPSGSGLMFAPEVNVTGGNVDITIGNTASGDKERIASVKIVRVPDKYRKPVIWVAGDSESANYYPINADGDDLDSSKIMMTGFGMQLSKFLSDKYTVANWGQPSATAGTWNSECLAAVTERMQKGDTILIDFGINDAISSSNKVDIETAKANIKLIVDAAKTVGAVPILISPIYNSKYQSKSYFTYNKGTDSNALGDYAKELDVSFIDLNRHSMLYVDNAKAETGDDAWMANNYHVSDNLHQTQYSALLNASFICAELKALGYETTDYAYTYHDLASAPTKDDGYVKTEESGVTRIYSVAEAEKFIAKTASPEETYSKEWSFDTDETAESGTNVPVVSGTAAWDEANQNIKFDASSKTIGTLSVTLDPAASGSTVKAAFDLRLGALGGQVFSYEIKDGEGTDLVTASIDAYNKKLSLSIAGTAAADSASCTLSTVTGDGMSAAVTNVVNEFDFASGTVTVTIGSNTYTGKLTGSETKSIGSVTARSARSKTAGRSIYLDNLSIKAYNSSDGGDTETSFPDFDTAVYTAEDGTVLPYRIYRAESSKSQPVLVYLHGATRNGSDNESQLYNSEELFNAVKAADPNCILIAPQCPADGSWSSLSSTVLALIDSIDGADTDRLYLAGFKEGANACYDIAAEGSLAAIMPINGTSVTEKAQAIAEKNTSVIAFNGSEDTENAREMIKALLDAGANDAQYNEFYGESGNVNSSAATAGAADLLLTKSLSTTAEKKIDLAIFMGQSNMAGRGEYADAVQCKLGHGYEFRSVTNPDMLMNVTGPFGKLENNDAINDNSGQGVDRRSGDMVSSVMESYYEATGTPLVGVQCSRGGTNTGYWNSSAQKAEAQRRLTEAKTYLEGHGHEIGHIFMVWVQGESDADKIFSGSQSADGYKSNTLKIFNYMKDAGVTDMFIVQTGHYNGSDDTDGTHDAAYVTVHDAQAALAEENENVYVVGDLLPHQAEMKDNYHYHQSAYNSVGIDAGTAIAEIYAQ